MTSTCLPSLLSNCSLCNEIEGQGTWCSDSRCWRCQSSVQSPVTRQHQSAKISLQSLTGHWSSSCHQRHQCHHHGGQRVQHFRHQREPIKVGRCSFQFLMAITPVGKDIMLKRNMNAKQPIDMSVLHIWKILFVSQIRPFLRHCEHLTILD